MRVEDALERKRASEMGKYTALGWEIIRPILVPALNSRGISIHQHSQLLGSTQAGFTAAYLFA